MQGMNWTDLQVFLAIAQQGQLAKAAAELRVDATTMGRRLRRLEMRLGATLFEQTRLGQVLTEAGEALLAQVEQMGQAAARIEDRGGATTGLSGLLRISVSEGLGTWLLGGRLADLAVAHPQLVVDLVASNSFLSPSKREADIAVTLSRPKAGPVLARKLSDYALTLYATPDYLASSGPLNRAEDLAHGHRLVGYVPDLVYAPELRYLDEVQPGLPLHLRLSSINAQHRLIAGGGGIGVLPCFIGNADPTLIAPLPACRIIRSFWLVTHKDTHQLRRVRAGQQWIEQVVASHRSLLLPD